MTKCAVMESEKRGNPPFEPSSYAAGLQRRVERHLEWRRKAMEAARLIIEGSDQEKMIGTAWWQEQFNPERVTLSGRSA